MFTKVHADNNMLAVDQPFLYVVEVAKRAWMKPAIICSSTGFIQARQIQIHLGRISKLSSTGNELFTN